MHHTAPPKKKIVLAVVGMCGTGKSVTTNYLTSAGGFKSIYFGGFVMEELKRRNLEINSVNEKKVREGLRVEHGTDVMAKLAYDRIVTLLEDGHDVICDGLYSFSEYLFLKEKLGNQLTVLAVHATKSLRYERLGNREVRPLNPTQVDDRDFSEIKNIEKAGPIAIADFHIVNDGNVEELHKKLDDILASIREKK